MDRPCIIAIGGASGTGKSTLSSRLASALGIERVLSTDLVRIVMRCMSTAQSHPELHCESFEVPTDAPFDGLCNLAGFEAQSKAIVGCCTPIVAHAVAERWSMVFEGVHLVPGLTQALEQPEADFIHIVLNVDDPEQHRSQFVSRGTTGGRGADHYLRNFDKIRAVQDLLCARAATFGVGLVSPTDALDTVIERLRATPTARR